MYDYKKMLYVEEDLEVDKLLVYLGKLNPKAKVTVDSFDLFFIFAKDNELLVDPFPKEAYINAFKNFESPEEYEETRIIQNLEKFKEYTIDSCTVEDLIKKIDSIMKYGVFGVDHANNAYYIHANNEEVCFTRKPMKECYKYQEPTEDDLEFLAQRTIASDRIRAILFNLKLRYNFDEEKVNSAFNTLLNNPDSFNDFFPSENFILSERTVLDIKLFYTLKPEFKEYMLNPFIMDKALEKKRELLSRMAEDYRKYKRSI